MTNFMLELLYLIGGSIAGYVIAFQFLKNKFSSNNDVEIIELKKQIDLEKQEYLSELKKINEINAINTENINHLHEKEIENLNEQIVKLKNDQEKETDSLEKNYNTNIASKETSHNNYVKQMESHHTKEIDQLNSFIEKIKKEPEFYIKEIGKSLKIDVTNIVKEANGDTLKFAKQTLAPEFKNIEKAKSKIEELANTSYIQTSSLQKEIITLSKAFDSNPHTRGEYGQESLRNMLERNGMIINIDFAEQQNMQRDEKELFPDFTIYLPKNETLVADAKAPIKNFKFAMEAEEGSKEQKEQLKKHAKAVRTYMNQLSSKAYWDNIKSISPQMVIMYLPADHFLSEACKLDPDIQQDAMKKNVLICTPISIFSVIKAIQASWNSYNTNENTKKIIEIFKDALGSIATLGVHMSKLQRSINTVSTDFGKVASSYNGNLIPKAKKIQDYGVDSGKQRLEMVNETKLIDKEIKLLTEKDLKNPTIMKEVV